MPREFFIDTSVWVPRIFFVLYLVGGVYAFVIAYGLWAQGADSVTWNGWAVVALLLFGRALAWGDRS